MQQCRQREARASEGESVPGEEVNNLATRRSAKDTSNRTSYSRWGIAVTTADLNALVGDFAKALDIVAKT